MNSDSKHRFLHRNWLTIQSAVTCLSDMAAITVSALTAFYIRQLIPGLPQFPEEVYGRVAFYAATGFLAFGALLGLYRRPGLASHINPYPLILRVYLFGVVGILLLVYLSSDAELPWRFMLIFVVIVLLLSQLFRIGLDRVLAILRSRGIGISNTLVVGYDREEISTRIPLLTKVGHDVRGIAAKNGNGNDPVEERPKISLVPYSRESLLQFVRTQGIEKIFIPSASFVADGYYDILSICRENRVKLKVVSPESDSLLRNNRINDVVGITLYSPPRSRFDRAREYVKRFTDIAGSLAFVILFSPILLGTALAIYLESGRPIFFKQRRAAIKGGREFDFLKFRSMANDADEKKDSLRDRNESDGALFKMKDDPRLTRVGRFIRKYSIDELPQLFNVLRGDMSLVGPRPLPVGDLARYKESDKFWEAIKDREKVKPGMTGLWQVSGRSGIGFREMVLLDLYYVENHSILYDLEILTETIPVVLFGKGAY